MKKIIIFGVHADARLQLSKIITQVPVEVAQAENAEVLGRLLNESPVDLLILDVDREGLSDKLLTPQILAVVQKWNGVFIVISSRRDSAAPLEALKIGASDFVAKPYNTRELLVHVNAALQKKKRVVCLGGGTGLFTVLMGLKTIPNLFLTSVVSMSDSGGSSGKLRSTFGMLPPGDVRRSLVALSNAPGLMNQIMQYRFERGGELKDHSFGNLFLTALAEITGSMSEAVRALADLLNIHGIVIPASATNSDLVALFENGVVVKGESRIDLCEGRAPEVRIEKLYHEPEAECNADVYAAILFADLVMIGPGDLYTSVIANLAIEGIAQALQKTRARKAYMVNVMTKPGETTHFSAADHIREILKYLGGDHLDYVLISNTLVSPDALVEYESKGQEVVRVDSLEELCKLTHGQVLAVDLVHEENLVRHDSEKIKKEILKIL